MDSSDAESLLGELKSVGLFDHLSEEQIEAFFNDVTTTGNMQLFDLLTATGNILDIRGRSGTDLGDYSSFLRDLRKLAQGKFEITGVSTFGDDGEILIRFKFNNRIYERRIYPSLGVQTYAIYLVPVANRALIDFHVDGRFYLILVPAEDQSPSPIIEYWIDRETFWVGGVAYLSHEQHRLMKDRLNIWAQDIIWSTHQILSLIAALREIGLFDHLSHEQIDAATQRVLRETDTGPPYEIFEAFPNTAQWFDTEIFEAAGVYIDLIEEAAGISHGACSPQDVTATRNPPLDEYVHLSFKVSGKTYTRDLSVNRDWIDMNYLTLMNEALEDTSESGRYYVIDRPVQDVIVLFLTPNQVDQVRKRDLLPLVEPGLKYYR